LVCDASGGQWEQALPAAAAIELLHNFSLIHDDIEDDSDTRRGRATVWTLWGIPQAINAGDSMFASAFDALGGLSDRKVAAEIVVKAQQIFTNACIKLTKGQHLDMWFETQDGVTVDNYLEMISGKTAALLVATTEIGSLVAQADSETQKHYGEFGRNVGLAFQAYDDILGVWGDEALLGKSTASDILTRKKTLPVLYGLGQSAELRDLYQQPEMDLQRAVALLDSVGAREYTQAAAQRYSDAAIQHLDAADPQGAAGEALRTLTAQLIQRKS
jgi:geranylgeranyl diphosphate synthase type I